MQDYPKIFSKLKWGTRELRWDVSCPAFFLGGEDDADAPRSTTTSTSSYDTGATLLSLVREATSALLRRGSVRARRHSTRTGMMPTTRFRSRCVIREGMPWCREDILLRITGLAGWLMGRSWVLGTTRKLETVKMGGDDANWCRMRYAALLPFANPERSESWRGLTTKFTLV